MKNKVVTVGIDAHKRKCVAACLYGDSNVEMFEFQTTREGLKALSGRVPEKTTVVIEASTTGKVISRLLSSKYDVHMVAPPERKPAVKTDERDAVRIAKEDSLGYLRRVYVPSDYVEEIRSVVMRQVQIGRKISRVKNQVHSLLDRNMIHELDDLSDIFGVEGLRRMAKLELPDDDVAALTAYLEELRLHLRHHELVETELARYAESDEDVVLLMTIPGMSAFTAVATKSRIGEISRFPDKKRLCSYAGVVPSASNSGEHVSRHGRVKRGDMVLKYALTCAVRGSVHTKGSSSVKAFYLKLLKKGAPMQRAEVAAARKMACIVWGVLSAKEPYVEEMKALTERKARKVALEAGREVPDAESNRSNIANLVNDISKDADTLARYSKDMEEIMGGAGDELEEEDDR
jgi:transposase